MHGSVAELGRRLPNLDIQLVEMEDIVGSHAHWDITHREWVSPNIPFHVRPNFW